MKVKQERVGWTEKGEKTDEGNVQGRRDLKIITRWRR